MDPVSGMVSGLPPLAGTLGAAQAGAPEVQQAVGKTGLAAVQLMEQMFPKTALGGPQR